MATLCSHPLVKGHTISIATKLMEKDSTETLARSQLETLYRLGVLERSSDDEDLETSFKSENCGVNEPHGAFLAALPPPSAVFPRMLRSSVDDPDSSRCSDSSKSGGFYAFANVSSSHLLRRCKSRRNSSLHSSNSSLASPSTPLPTANTRLDPRALRMWFRRWRVFITYRREKTQRRALADAFVKHKVVTKWAAFLTQRRCQHDKKRLLESWKAFRAISRWSQWKRRSCLLRGVLQRGRSSFLGRVWRRWLQFSKRRKFVRLVLTDRTEDLRLRRVRTAWTELLAYAFRARQDSHALRRCLKAMRDFLAIQERRRSMCEEHLQTVNRGRKRALLQLWRAFTAASVRDRKLAGRVQFDVRRRRYFLLWCEVARSVDRVEQLRWKIASRVLCQHFSAWKSRVRAVQMGDGVRKKGEQRIREIYFRVFKDVARFAVHCSHVTMVLTHRRLAVAVKHLHAWTIERKRRRKEIHRVREMGQTRLLRQVWLTGWLRVHRKRLAVKHVCLVIKARYIRGWKRFHRIQQAYYLQEEQAEALHDRFCCKRAFEGWKSYYKLCLELAQELVKGQEHYRLHLLQRGVVLLWGAVYQNAQSSLRAHHLRQNMRTSLKKRHFHAWFSLVHSRKQVSERLCHLQQSAGYQNSICNPSRRTWNRWMMLVSMCRGRHRCDRHYQVRLKRQVLFGWHRQAKVVSHVRVFSLHKRRRDVEALFGHWKSRVEKWKKVDVVCELAERVYERKLCTRVIRELLSRSTFFRRVRLCGESIRREREMKIRTMWFLEWREKFEVSQCFSRLKRSRGFRLLRMYFMNWLNHSAQQKTFTRKLTHFQKVYGTYPASSIVSRAWYRWQYTCIQIRYVKALHRRHQLRQARRCWSHWMDFHAACCAFRAWRRVARKMSTSNNKRGLLLRVFREARRHQLQRCWMNKWKGLVGQGRHLQERQSLLKHQLNRELEGSRRSLKQAARLYLSRWFRRWCIAHNNGNELAGDYFRCRLLSKMVLSWWKATIHLKQEKVLLEAQQAMAKLSYYHPQQQVCATQARRTGNRKKVSKKLPTRKERPKVVPKDDTNARSESIRRMRRMLDPTEYASYSRFYQESAKEVSWNEPNCTATKPAPAKIRVGISVSDPEPRPRMYNDQSPRGSQIRRVESETCYCVESSDENIEKGTINGIEIANCNSRDASRATGKSVSTRDVPVPPVTSNQVSFKLQNIHPSAESQGHSHRDHFPGLLELSDKPQSTNAKAAANVLPLFDDEVEAGKITNQTDHIDIPPRRVRFAPDLRSTQAADTLVQATCADQNESFVPSANTSERGGNLDLRRNPQALIAESREYECDVRLASGDSPVMFHSSLSLATATDSNRIDQQHQPRVVKTRRTGRQKQIKVVNAGNNEERPLADILELNDRGEANLSEYSEAHATTTWNDGDVWDASVLKEMMAFYADSVMAHAGENIGLRTTRVRICYRMARDFALLQNDFYIDELQKVYDGHFKDTFSNFPRSVVDPGKLEEEKRLELFLEQLVESHPAYRKYVDLSLRRNDAHSPAETALNWLAQHHLRPQLTLLKRARARPRKSKTHWIWEPMPADMDIALEKLLPAIKKYMRVLGQFFLRQAVQSSSTTDKPQDCRMSSTAFISLMKQLRVFPQLFHRRELENAVRLSCCSSPETEELNFPEFIEALVRCSCNLRWGELDEGKHASESSSGDTVVVIKFVMLIFAMEGQGSVLKKRNEDVSAILGFLGQQQKKQQAEKLFRFRKMLAENKRRSRASKNHQLPSVWNQVRLQFSPKSSPPRSPTKSQDTFHELTESWDGGSPRQVSTEPFVFDAQTNQPFDLDVPPSPNVDAIAQQSDRQSQQGSVGFVNTGQDGDNLSGGSVDGASFRPPSSSELLPPMFVLGASGNVDDQSEAMTLQEELAAAMEFYTAPTVHRERKESIPATRDSDNLATTASVEITVNSEQVRHCTASSQSTALVEPMEKDEFLREILDSIGDVELMLSQPKFTGSNFSKHGRKQSRRTLASTSVESTHGEDHADLMEGFLSLSELAGGNLVHDWQHHHDGTLSSNADADSEAQVRDPMLNYLTGLERFTESTDHASLVAIAGMAGLPFTQDPTPQDHISEQDACASQEIRPTEEVPVNTPAPASTHESDTHENTIK